jgi:hypothetical protein
MAASGSRSFLSGKTAAACEIVKGMRPAIVTTAGAGFCDQLWQPFARRRVTRKKSR